MDIRRLTDEISVSGQIKGEDVARLAAAGFKSIICNRPDGEGADQPLFREIEAAAKAANLEARYVPVISGKLEDADAAGFASAIQELSKPVLAYCRTGTRSTSLWSMCEAKSRPLPEILATAKSAGFDVSGIVRRMAKPEITS